MKLDYQLSYVMHYNQDSNRSPKMPDPSKVWITYTICVPMLSTRSTSWKIRLMVWTKIKVYKMGKSMSTLYTLNLFRMSYINQSPIHLLLKMIRLRIWVTRKDHVKLTRNLIQEILITVELQKAIDTCTTNKIDKF